MTLSLASVFTSNMVLQQGMPLPVWGSASPGATVTVTINQETAETTVGAMGNWMVHIAPLSASAEPTELSVTATLEGQEPQALILDNVLVGEVWVCSGQSNMEWPLSLCRDASNEAESANYPAIRLFNVPKRAAATPELNIEDARWEECSPSTAWDFSGVGYFFGRELHQRLQVPVGLVNASWGGTVAQAWTSRESLLGQPEVRHLVEDFENQLPHLEVALQRWVQEMGSLHARVVDDCNPVNPGFEQGWAALEKPATGHWQSMKLPGPWQSRGLNFSGVFWFRLELDLPTDWVNQDLELNLGAVDKSDVTYFNGAAIGSLTMKDNPEAWSTPRSYAVPAALVRPGTNVLAVRVHSGMFQGGLTGPAPLMKLSCTGLPGTPAVDLNVTWEYAVEANYGLVQPPPEPMGPTNQNAPSTLFNGMIHPLLPLAMRGAIWYQGESNASLPREYQKLFPTLIEDWRSRFSNADHAFHFVQLANYMASEAEPVESNWAELREAQAMALALPHTGMAVTIDIGEAEDIHPRNKQDVGLRLAQNALHHTYGQTNVVPCGPLFRNATIQENQIRLHFDYSGGGLVAQDGALRGFAIASEDGKFVWAQARIEDETVVVFSPQVPSPRAVRYNWANNPDGNLYNAAGLPASPFRTDPVYG